MRYLSLIAVAICLRAHANDSGSTTRQTISFDSAGRNNGEIPKIKAGDRIFIDFPKGLTFTYQFSTDIGDGKLLSCSNPQTLAPDGVLTIPTEVQVGHVGPNGEVTESKSVRAVYFNLLGKVQIDPGDQARLDELTDQLSYYSALNAPLQWRLKKSIQDQIADKSDTIAQLEGEIKAYSGMSLPAAVSAIDERQRTIRELRTQIKALQRAFDNSGLQDQVTSLKTQVEELTAKINSGSTPQLLRAGILLVGEHATPVYYSLEHSADASAPWSLKRFQKFPVLTTDDVPYVVVLGQRYQQDPQALRASFTSKAGSYLDAEPVRPLLIQAKVASANVKAPCGADALPTFAFVDRLLQFTNHLAGETVYAVTVTGYGAATTVDTVTVAKGTAESYQKQTVIAKTSLKPLDSDSWPQVHSLYRYNLTTGVVWTSIHNATFSRVATGEYVPAGCVPTMSVATTGPTSSTVTGTTTTTTSTGSSTTGTTTTSSPSTTTTTTCMPTYNTLQVSGGPRILPVFMFSYYWTKRDTQTKDGSWSWAVPVPTIGLSLTSPSDDFFLGGSSEFKFLRNVQLVYGAHLGRVSKLGANSFQNPTDSTAPQTTTSLHIGEFVGLTFNLDFLKDIFKQ